MSKILCFLLKEARYTLQNENISDVLCFSILVIELHWKTPTLVQGNLKESEARVLESRD
jgi:hypothetical protein